MKNSELIAELQAMDPDTEVRIAVYGCGGYDDSHDISDVEEHAYDGSKWITVDIDVSCGVHRKPFKTDCGAV